MATGSDLPLEIIEDILYRLPAKSLVRFTSVSKPWSCLISELIKTLLHQKRTKILLSRIDDQQSLYSIDMPGKNQPDIATPVKLSFHENPNIDNERLVIHGSCNGLVLAGYDHENIFLLNPTTCESKKLPPLRSGVDDSVLYGLGYDSSTYDYKVVVASDCIQPNFVFSFNSVYSLQSNRWRFKHDHGSWHGGCDVYGYSTSIFLNGCLHWLLKKSNLPKPSFIACFGLADDKSSTLQLTDYGFLVDDEKEQFRPSHELYDLGGFLSFGVFEYRRKSHVWVMKEYGMSESWTKIFVYDSREAMTRHIFLRGDEAIVFRRSSSRNAEEVIMFPFIVMEAESTIELLHDEATVANRSHDKIAAEPVLVPIIRISLPLRYRVLGTYIEGLVSLDNHHAMEEI